MFRTSSWKKISVEQAQKMSAAYEMNNKLLEQFCPTKKIDNYISFDENNRLWKNNNSNLIFRYEDIISYELLEDGQIITKGGSCGEKTTVRQLEIQVVTRHEFVPKVYINFLRSGPTKYNGFIYKGAKWAAYEALAQFERIKDFLEHKEKISTITMSGADEIMKYKQLLDNGIITNEEFEAKKKQLLGL